VTSQKPKSRDGLDGPSAKARQVALGLLARREHSVLELNHKLLRRGFGSAEVEQVIEGLSAENLLSDVRFAEVYAHSRVDRGYGPLRIRRELRERGVSDDTVSGILTELDDDWSKHLVRVHHKRFGDRLPTNAAEKASQLRFLRHRGFTLEQIKRLFQQK
jgi:regulatory protein